MLEVTVNLLMFDREGALSDYKVYSVLYLNIMLL